MTKKATRTRPVKPHRVKVASRLRAELKVLRRAGWTMTTGGGHSMLTCPAGHHSYPVPQDDGGAVLAFRARIRHHPPGCA